MYHDVLYSTVRRLRVGPVVMERLCAVKWILEVDSICLLECSRDAGVVQVQHALVVCVYGS